MKIMKWWRNNDNNEMKNEWNEMIKKRNENDSNDNEEWK